MKHLFLQPLCLLWTVCLGCLLGTENVTAASETRQRPILPGACQTESYFPLLKNRQVGVVANHTSRLGETHLVDSLLHAGVKVVRIFSPEHGFRGLADAGEKVESGVDAVTGLQVVSLYASHRKPAPEDMQGIDIMVFDLQDAGARFYTYISTLHYVMDACAEAGVPLLVLDRPNPNGWYVDGPVLEPDMASFVGMHAVPVVYGMTIGEYACMINGEHWLADGVTCRLQVIPCVNYNHQRHYNLPVAPSPNLQTDLAVALYPSLCFFEGTVCSVGRGTGFPFMVFGHPDLRAGDFHFTPQSGPGARSPLLENRDCRGVDLRQVSLDTLYTHPGLHLEWLLFAYRNYPDQARFFTSYFDTLAGNHTLQQQIKTGLSADEIRASWQPALAEFEKIRAKYLLYTL